MKATKSRVEPPIATLLAGVEPPVGLVLAQEKLVEIAERQAELRVQRDTLKSGGVAAIPRRSTLANMAADDVRELSRVLRDIEAELSQLAAAESDALELLAKSKRSWARAIEAAAGGRRAVALERFKASIDSALADLAEIGAVDTAIRQAGGAAPAAMGPAHTQLKQLGATILQAISANGKRQAA